MFAQYPLAMLAALWVSVHALTECAWRVGRRRGATREDTVSVEPASALLAILGLLLAFTVSMAVNRFDVRKQLVVDEANAIGTAELRARLLPEATRDRSRALFDDYLDRRVRWGEAAGDEAAQRRLVLEAIDYQNQLWQIAVGAGTATPTPVFALYEGALNRMIDLAAERSHVRANRIPETVLLLLGATTLLANGLFAGVLGRNNKKRSLDLHVLAFSTWLVIALIVDFDRPRRGWVQVSQEPLVQLREAWRGTPLAR